MKKRKITEKKMKRIPIIYAFDCRSGIFRPSLIKFNASETLFINLHLAGTIKP